MLFQKEDLEGKHYTWNTDEDKKQFLGQPSRRLFDPFNGDQKLFLINFCGSQSNKFTVEEGKRIENQIYHHLPADVKSEISVFNWIKSAVFPTNEASNKLLSF